MRLSKPGLRQHSKRNVIAWPKDMTSGMMRSSSSFTLAMEIYLICST
ncbi:hypothetical protein Gotur_008952 [Gossypium turneri]